MKFRFLLLSAFASAMAFAQQVPEKDTLHKELKPKIEAFAKKASVKVLFVGDYGKSLTKDVDVTGKHAPGSSDNGFYLKYVRINGKYEILKNLSVQVLVNLAEFKGDTKYKVLEIAALKWTPSPYMNFQIGQFRPYFGLEDMYPAEIMKSYDWSNLYKLLGKSNYQSFQLGGSVYGSLSEKKIPLRYYYTMYNGNGRNQPQDDDDAKNHAFRLEYDVIPKLQIGANTTLTKVLSQNAALYGVDVSWSKKINDLWNFDLQTEFMTGTNIAAFHAATATDKDISDYKLKGVYVLPVISRTLNKDSNSALEFSFRYEYLEDLQNGNPGRFYTPVLSYVIGSDYTSKVSLVGVLSDYNRNIANTSQYDSNLLLLQYQLRF